MRKRLMNKDGTFNVIQLKGDLESARGSWQDTYHFILRLSWPQFLLGVVALYFSLNLIFASAYLANGPGALEGVTGATWQERFFDAFFFSVQTLATIGYGRISPIGLIPNLLVTFEALVGMLTIALATGLMFAKFARPTARVRFSRVALIADHDGTPSFVFRMANERNNQVVEASVNVVLSIMERTKEGEIYRTFCDLNLERKQTPIFALSWTVVHPIDDRSPLKGHTLESLTEAGAEVIITLTGIDDTFGQAIHARSSYTPDEIAWSSRFADMLKATPEGDRYADLSALDQVLPLSIEI